MAKRNWAHRFFSILITGMGFLLLASGCGLGLKNETISGISQSEPADIPAEHNPTGMMETMSKFDCVPVANGYQTARFIRVIDGDTIEVRMDDRDYRVRYIGIDAPEHDEGLGREAGDFNASLVDGQELYLVRDVSDTDEYGRLLRYVFTQDAFVNDEILSHGYARQGDYPPDTACSELFAAAEKDAAAAGAGIWASPVGEDGTTTLQIVDVNYRGKAGENEPDEFVEIRNSGSQAVNISGWYLKDQGKHRFVFPAKTLKAGEICRVYTAEDHPETCGFSFDNPDSAVWNNSGDCAALYDAGGLLVDEFCFP